MRTLNVRLAVLLVVGVVVFGVGVYFVHGYQARRNAHVFKDAADRAVASAERAIGESNPRLAQKQYFDALQNLGWYLRLRPEDVDVLDEFAMQSADWADRVGDSRSFSRAFSRLEAVLRRDPNRDKVRRRLVDMAMRMPLQQGCPLAKEHLKTLVPGIDGDKPLVLSPEHPEWPELQLLYGQCQDLLGDYASAVTIYDKVIQCDPAQVEAYVRLAQLLRSRLKRPEDADAWMNRMVQRNPNSAKAHVLKGQYLYQKFLDLRSAATGDRSRGEELEKLIDQAYAEVLAGLKLAPNDRNAVDVPLSDGVMWSAPDEGESLWLAAQCALAKGQSDVAREVAREYVSFGIEQNPRFSALYLALADIEMRAGNPDRAVDAYLDGIRANPQQLYLLDRLAHTLIDLHPQTEMGQPDITRESADRIGQSLNVTAARLERKLAEPDPAAQTAARPGVSRSLVAAQRVAKALEAMEYRKPDLAFMKARLDYVQGHWLKARQGFENIRSTLSARPDALKQVDYWIGVCYGQAGEYDRQLQAYRRALSIDPFYAPARAGVIEALQAAGRVDEAMEEYGRFARGQGDAIAVARMMIQRNRQKAAAERNWEIVERFLAQAEKSTPDSPQIPLLRAQAFVAQNQTDEACKVLEEFCRKSRQRSELLTDMAFEAVQEQFDWNEAEALLREAHQESVARSECLRELASLAEMQDNWDKAEGLLAEAGKSGDGLGQRLAQVRYLVLHCEDSVGDLRRGAAEPPPQEAIDRLHKEAAQALRALAENADALSDAERARLWSVLAADALQLDDTAQAEQLQRRVTQLCQQIAAKEPDNAQIRYQLLEQALTRASVPGPGARGKDVNAEASLRAESDAAIEKALAEIERVAGRNEYWFYGQAVRVWLRARDGGSADELSKALKFLSQAQELRPTWTQIALLEAQIYDQQGETTQALEHYQDAIRLGARSVNTIQRTVEILSHRQQYAEADRLLRQLEKEQMPFSAELNLESAQTALSGSASGQQEFDRALQMARKAAAQESKNYRTHVRLGQLLGSLGRKKKKEADQLTAQATELENKDRAKQAEAARVRAEQALAQANEVLKEAETSLRSAIKLGPEASETWWALVQFLAAAQEGEKAAQVIADAGQTLSAEQAPLVQAMCYDILQRLAAAQEKYETALAAAPENPQTIRLVAEFYRRTGRSADAEALLRKIVDQGVKAQDSDVISARRSLADIVLARGGDANLQKARDLIEKNLATAKPAVEDRRRKAWLDAADSRPARRASAIRGLEALVQEQAATADDRFRLAQAYLAAGDWAQASAQLRYLAANYRTELRYTAAYIRALLQHGEIADAKLYLGRLEEAAPQDLGTICLRAEALAAEGEWPKALALLDQIESKFSASTLADVCSRLVSHGTADKVQLQRLDDILEVAINRFHRDPLLLLAMADLRSRQGRYDGAEGAEALYREILAKQDRDVLAMNNLAVLLALRGVKLDEALQLVNGAIEIVGPMAAMLDSRASVHMARGEPAEALKDMAEALADAELPVRLFHQACACEQAGQHDAAVAAMKKALSAGKEGLTARMLHPLELPTFEKLRQLAR